jgi:hypothetical protein
VLTQFRIQNPFLSQSLSFVRVAYIKEDESKEKNRKKKVKERSKSRELGKSWRRGRKWKRGSIKKK